MKKLIYLFIFIISFSIAFGGCNNLNLLCDFNSIGVWWWNDELNHDKYLSFAYNNGITDIYYCTSNFSQNTSNFISKANNFNINVHLLAGEYQWLENSSNLYALIENYLNYQNAYPLSKFSGIHLDIEPHQHPEFDNLRQDLILSLIKLADNLKITYPDILFAYDIPFWLEDEIIFNNVTLPAYAHMINIANSIHIMSYRDTAQKIYEISQDEINYANFVNKRIYLSVETKSSEGDLVSFMEEGKKYMYDQILNLYNFTPNVGINIHQIKTWYDLKR